MCLRQQPFHSPLFRISSHALCNSCHWLHYILIRPSNILGTFQLRTFKDLKRVIEQYNTTSITQEASMWQLNRADGVGGKWDAVVAWESLCSHLFVLQAPPPVHEPRDTGKQMSCIYILKRLWGRKAEHWRHSVHKPLHTLELTQSAELVSVWEKLVFHNQNQIKEREEKLLTLRTESL